MEVDAVVAEDFPNSQSNDVSYNKSIIEQNEAQSVIRSEEGDEEEGEEEEDEDVEQEMELDTDGGTERQAAPTSSGGRGMGRGGQPISMTGRGYPRRGRGSRGRRGSRGGRWGGRGRWANHTPSTDSQDQKQASLGSPSHDSLPSSRRDDDDREEGDTTTKVKERGIRGRKPNPATLVAAQWVACDSCGKWRRLPRHLNVERDLPEEWLCSMNSWDSQRNSCDAPEEVVPPPPPEESQAPTAAKVPGSGPGRGRWGPRSIAAVTEDRDKDGASDGGGDADSDEDSPETEGGLTGVPISSGRGSGRGGRRGRGRGRGMAQEMGAQYGGRRGGGAVGGRGAQEREVVEVNWVQCNSCQKWRKVPIGVDMSSFPDVWYCRLNFWDPTYAKCNVREEADEKAAGTAGPAAEPPAAGPVVHMGRGRYPRKPKLVPDGMAVGQGQSVKKVTQWVQCERVTCKKWRKIPATVDMATLPEKWYCEMNKWDPERARCEDPEDSDDSEPDEPANTGDGPSLVFANSKGPGRLSYRRIIFGTDGKVRPAYGEKNKTGFGVFSYTDTHRPAALATQAEASSGEDYVEPTRRVGYWWSSCYDEAGAHYTSSSRRGASTLGSAMAAKRERDAEASSVAPAQQPQDKNESKGQQSMSLQTPSHTGVPIALDCIRRLFGWEPSPPPNIKLKSRLRVCRITMLERMHLECRVVTSCLHQLGSVQVAVGTGSVGEDEGHSTAQSESGPFGGTTIIPEPVTLTALLAFIATSAFHDVDLDCVRAEMDLHALRSAVRRLEVEAELDVSYNPSGQIVVQLFGPSVEYPAIERRPLVDKFALFGDQPPTGELLELSQAARPLKMRKLRYLQAISEVTSESSSSSAAAVAMEVSDTEDRHALPLPVPNPYPTPVPTSIATATPAFG